MTTKRTPRPKNPFRQPRMPTVIQHGLHTAVKELPLEVTVHTQQISPAHIKVTVTY